MHFFGIQDRLKKIFLKNLFLFFTNSLGSELCLEVRCQNGFLFRKERRNTTRNLKNKNGKMKFSRFFRLIEFKNPIIL